MDLPGYEYDAASVAALKKAEEDMQAQNLRQMLLVPFVNNAAKRDEIIAYLLARGPPTVESFMSLSQEQLLGDLKLTLLQVNPMRASVGFPPFKIAGAAIADAAIAEAAARPQHSEPALLAFLEEHNFQQYLNALNEAGVYSLEGLKGVTMTSLKRMNVLRVDQDRFWNQILLLMKAPQRSIVLEPPPAPKKQKFHGRDDDKPYLSQKQQELQQALRVAGLGQYFPTLSNGGGYNSVQDFNTVDRRTLERLGVFERHLTPMLELAFSLK
jgi:hypothetical protein